MNSKCINFSPALERFSKFLQENRGQITPKKFSEEFGKVEREYLAQKQKDVFCYEAENLAQELIETKNSDFAGIIMSFLCKLMQFRPEKLEGLAQKGVLIAEINHDPIHMMARLNDLRRIYFRVPNKLFNYIQVLFKQEKCLKKIINNYENSLDSFHTVARQPAPKRDYELMLAHVQTEIAKITKRKHPLEAQEKLIEARQTFETRGYRKNVGYIDMLLGEIKNEGNIAK